MRISAVAFSTNGCATALRLRDALREDDVSIFCKTSSDTLGVDRIEGSLSEWTGRAFAECDAIVFIGAVGIAVRHIAPFIKCKTEDPAVVAMDEHGRWAIALLSGHIGGCNELTARIAERMGSEPIVTTATDLNGRFAVDTFARANGLRISDMKVAKDVSARVLDGRFVGFSSELPVEGGLPAGLTAAESGEFGVRISRDPSSRPFGTTLNLTPMDIVLGVGCRRGTDPSAMDAFVRRILAEDGIAPERVAAVASIDIKRDEEAILSLSEGLGVPSVFYTAAELNAVPGEFTASEFVAGVTSVDCVCERSAARAGGADFIRRKTAESGMTAAVCSKPISPRFP
ncbi:MAG: cobalt-precorrin 5A hydrolase [Thermoplasmata archaeon]|nr:cobalt-precorrin 5A hydrolase [Thermoplasmata archaeon]